MESLPFVLRLLIFFPFTVTVTLLDVSYSFALGRVPQNSDELNPGLRQNSKANFFLNKAL